MVNSPLVKTTYFRQPAIAMPWRNTEKDDDRQILYSAPRAKIRAGSLKCETEAAAAMNTGPIKHHLASRVLRLKKYLTRRDVTVFLVKSTATKTEDVSKGKRLVDSAELRLRIITKVFPDDLPGINHPTVPRQVECSNQICVPGTNTDKGFISAKFLTPGMLRFCLGVKKNYGLSGLQFDYRNDQTDSEEQYPFQGSMTYLPICKGPSNYIKDRSEVRVSTRVESISAIRPPRLYSDSIRPHSEF
ncbi:hypothetical protein Tco_0409939 [Tanacetum coccineum]